MITTTQDETSTNPLSRQILSRKTCPLETMWLALYSHEPGWLEILAAHPAAPSELLDALVRLEPSCLGRPGPGRSRMASHSQYAQAQQIRLLVAGNRNCTATTLQYLIRDRDPRVKINVARNPSADTDTLTALYRCWGIPRMAIVHMARHPNCPAFILIRLARDTRVSVRRGLVHNPSCPEEIVGRLSHDKDLHIQEQALQHPHYPIPHMTHVLAHGTERQRQLVLASPYCPDYLKVVMTLAKS